MNEQDIQTISSYLDGELSTELSATLEARLAAEPALRAQLEQMRRVDQLLRGSLASETRVPAQITALLQPEASNVVQLRPRREQRWSVAIAASLLAGVILIGGQQWLPGTDSNLLVPDIAQAAAFSEILDEQASSATQWHPVKDGVQMRPVLTFASNGGTWCREFLANQAAETWRGVACRRAGQWDVELLVQSPGLAAENTGGYQTASADSADLVASFIDDNSSDIPLGLKQESALISTDWN